MNYLERVLQIRDRMRDASVFVAHDDGCTLLAEAGKCDCLPVITIMARTEAVGG